MFGRYGVDQLSKALLIISIIILLVADFIRIPVLVYISYIPLIVCFYRMFSRNINKRSSENYKFTMFMQPVYAWSRKTFNRIKYLKTRKYFKCPNCKTTIWVPKGAGKIVITCPKCKTEFREKA